jgi:hypothetical protein
MVKYVGENKLWNAEKFKYTWINKVGLLSQLPLKVAASASQAL